MLTSSLVSTLAIVHTFVVVYKFVFNFSLLHCKVTVVCCIAITLIIGSLSVFLGSESVLVFSIFVSISVYNTDESVFLEALNKSNCIAKFSPRLVKIAKE